MNYIATFEVPVDIAKELSSLTGKEKIRKDLLLQSINNQDTFDRIEYDLISIMEKLEALKQTITDKYVPEEYKSEEYVWIHNGWEIDKNVFGIINASDMK